MNFEPIPCPACGRKTRLESGRFRCHSASDRTHKMQCWMSGQRPPVKGDTPDDYLQRAVLVAELAFQVQDEDPELAWNRLTAMPATEVQKLCVLALAAIRTDQTVEQMFAWVGDLPVAQRRSA